MILEKTFLYDEVLLFSKAPRLLKYPNLILNHPVLHLFRTEDKETKQTLQAGVCLSIYSSRHREMLGDVSSFPREEGLRW